MLQARRFGVEFASDSIASPDLHGGLSGLILLELTLFRLTADHEHLALAERYGEQIIATAEAGAPGLYWRNKNQPSRAGDNRFLGYLHGTAGIADALLALGVVSQQERFRAAAAEAGVWLATNSLSLSDKRFILWPKAPSAKSGGVCLGHGAAGIGRFFLHACRDNLLPNAGEFALRAARSVAAAHWLGPSLGYGLAGDIDFLIEAYEYLREPWLLDAAGSLCQSLLRSRNYQFSELRSFRLECTVGAPAYLTGYAGVFPVLLRVRDLSN